MLKLFREYLEWLFAALIEDPLRAIASVFLGLALGWLLIRLKRFYRQSRSGK